MKPDLVIFNLDGTLLNTRNLIKESLESIFKSLNLYYDERLLNSIIDNPITKLKETVRNYYEEPNYAESIYTSYKLILKKTNDKQNLKIKEGAKELLKYLNSKKYNVIGVSSNNIEPAISKLKEEGLLSMFSSITKIEEKDKKSYSEKLTKLTRRFKASPEKCLVFDDSKIGISSAKNTGMLPILVLTTNEPSDDILLNSFKILKNLDSAKKIID